MDTNFGTANAPGAVRREPLAARSLMPEATTTIAQIDEWGIEAYPAEAAPRSERSMLSTHRTRSS
jgi:hypothetical protein